MPETCHICQGTLKEIPGYQELYRVTSDCKPWPAGGRLAQCTDCGCAQAVLDSRWHAEAANIYSNYKIYHQSGGVEQSVFDPAGAAMNRSSRLVQRLQENISLPGTGTLLDVGCGNGAFLRAFTRSTTGWDLAGVEVNDHYQLTVEKIPGVQAFYVGQAAEVPGTYDLISLVHVLEHVPAPSHFLRQLVGKLRPAGRLLVQVPDCAVNPFMLLVADHATHFTCATLQTVADRADTHPEVVTDQWIAKELTLVGSQRRLAPAPAGALPYMPQTFPAAAHVTWLQSVAEKLRQSVRNGPIGVFGTSIAATWIFQEVHGQVAFFVDEDIARHGQTFCERPIYAPADAPRDTKVFLGLPYALAKNVGDRLGQTQLQFILPPAV